VCVSARTTIWKFCNYSASSNIDVMAKTIRPGTYVKVETDAGRIRHARVTAVTDQDNITTRLGTPKTSASATFEADRVVSTTTRGTIFIED
jgi:hypothetical protein